MRGAGTGLRGGYHALLLILQPAWKYARWHRLSFSPEHPVAAALHLLRPKAYLSALHCGRPSGGLSQHQALQQSCSDHPLSARCLQTLLLLLKRTLCFQIQAQQSLVQLAPVR